MRNEKAIEVIYPFRHATTPLFQAALQISAEEAGLFPESPYDSRGELRYETSIELYTPFVTQLPDFFIGAFQGTLYETKESPLPYGFIRGVDVDSFVNELRSLHEQPLESKESGWLISPAIFDPDKPNDENKKRGLVYILGLRHLWFDFENGQLRPDELPKLFP